MSISIGPSHLAVIIGLLLVAFSVREGWEAREGREDAAGRLLMESFFVFAVGVLCYPLSLARAIDRAVGIVDVAHLVSMVAVTTTMVLLLRLTTELTPEAHRPLRAWFQRLIWLLLAAYIVVWMIAHWTLHLTDDLFYTGYYARPVVIGVLNTLAGITFIIAGAGASFGFWRISRPTQVERIAATTVRAATIIAMLYGIAICIQVTVSALGGPQFIHHFMAPLGLTGVLIALLGSAVFTDGLLLTSTRRFSWMQQLVRSASDNKGVGGTNALDALNEPAKDAARMIAFLDDRVLTMRGAVKQLLLVVGELCKERGFSEKWTKLALQATRIGILDPSTGSQPYDRDIHLMCHYARRNDWFVGNTYRITLAVLGPGAVPFDESMPALEPWHEEIAGVIREAVYRYYGVERGRAIIVNQGIVLHPDPVA